MNISNTSIWANVNGNRTGGPTFIHVPMDVSERVRFILGQPNNIIALSLGFAAIALNILSILAITKTHNNLTSYYRLIVSLAISDILIGVSVVLSILNNAFNPRGEPGEGPWSVRERTFCLFIIIKALNTTALNITLLNLMGMAIELFLAIVRPLHYPSMMNKQRATITIGIFWTIAILCGFSDFFSVYPKYKKYTWKYNYCEFSYLTKYQEEYPTFAIALVCFFSMSFFYLRIMVVVRQRHRNISFCTELKRNKKALCTTLIILFTFVVCWLPMCLFQITLIIRVNINVMQDDHVIMALLAVDKYLYDLVLVNCILDPIIYAIRMPDVQQGYRRLFCRCGKRQCRQMSTTDITHSAIFIEEHKISMGSIRLNLAKVVRNNHSPTANDISNTMRHGSDANEESIV